MLLLAGFRGEIDDFGLFFISNLQASAPPPLIDWALHGVKERTQTLPVIGTFLYKKVPIFSGTVFGAQKELNNKLNI